MKRVLSMMAAAMKYRGFAGAVIDASVPDTPQIRKLQFPVFSRGVAPSTTINHYRVTGVNVPVTCAGVRVNPGDIITADEDGVVHSACSIRHSGFHHHSYRSARIGSIRLARRAGINPAAAETIVNSTIVHVAIQGSLGVMP